MMNKKKNRSIAPDQILIEDDFWSRIQTLVREIVIPYQEKILNDEIPGVEKSHALANFRIAAGLEEGEFYGMVFQDSDVAKWLEGVAYSLAVHPDAALEERADRVIEIIEKAQCDDGYLNTYFTVKEPEHRWQNLLECHELYCAGHMMEAAAAYYECTGKDRLLQVMRRMADHIDRRFGPGKETGIPGHQEIEIGLLKLYHVTGEERYLRLAEYFLEERGKNPDFFREEAARRDWTHFGMDPEDTYYNQSYDTVYNQKDAVGHSVRAVYMYTAMADLAGIQGNEKLYQACCTLWDSITQKRMYLTAGIGSSGQQECFTKDYDLPNDRIYAETCASIGLIFYAKRMLECDPDGRYADVMERAFFNGTISGMQLDGRRFFYVNPLEVNPGISGEIFGLRHVLPQRPEWYTCACCPPNLVRLLTSLGHYLWDETPDTIYSHMFAGQEAELEKARIKVKSLYPWEGAVSYTVQAKTQQAFRIGIHIPSYIRRMEVRLNREVIDAEDKLDKGYLYLKRIWGEADEIRITFAMPVRRIYANQKLLDDAGKAALMRGPLVYCFEGVDNQDASLQSLSMAREPNAEIYRITEGPLAGMTGIRVDGKALYNRSEALYTEETPEVKDVRLTAIPYFAWSNRGENQMRVWMRQE
ncbi:MAG: glycoside hydrolase family 127 protein [Lachnospiraceae bacterium]|nr:glycoside hydrolase family 127 protein [Lachnospiraceae bacterium]